jgi:hypothetical protein
MKFTQLDIALMVLLAAGGLYLFKTRGDLMQFKNSYNVLAEQLASGKLTTNTAQQ